MSRFLPKLHLLLDQLKLDRQTAPDETQWRAFLDLLGEDGLGTEPQVYALGLLDPTGRIVRWDSQFAPLSYGPEIVGQQMAAVLTSPLEGLRLEQLIGELSAENPQFQVGLRFQGADGQSYLMYCTLTAVLDGQSEVAQAQLEGLLLSTEDSGNLTGERFYTGLLNAMPVPVVVLDREMRYVFCNPIAVRNPEIREWIIGKTDTEYVSYRGFNPEIAVRRETQYRQAVAEHRSVQFEEMLTGAGGQPVYQLRNYTPVYNKSGTLLLGLGHGIEITDLRLAQQALTDLNDDLEKRVRTRTAELEQLSQQLHHDAFHDPLTGLPNRTLFLDRLEQAIYRAAQEDGQPYAVLFLDTDRFKRVNDTLGHPAGDEMLCELARRLRRVLRNSDTVARLGGDEFAVLLEPLPEPERASEVARRIQEVLRQPMKIADYDMAISVSIGVVLGNASYDSAVSILRDADIAMYRAKAAGRAHYKIFTTQMRRETIDMNLLENDLRQALQQGELRVVYQSVVRLADLKVTGFEALVRWQHPERGLLEPADFISIAEESGLVLEIDRWVMHEACLQMQTWEAEHPNSPRLSLSVNFSGRQFSLGVADYVSGVLQKTGFDPYRLNLEVTEGTLLAKPHDIAETLGRLRALGIELHLDDFGTGYSSLSYLQAYPLDTLKIDRSFIGGMLDNDSSGELVRTIVSLAKNMKLRTVAEGIESHEQLRVLRDLKCEYGQGYLFSRPLPMSLARTMVDTLPQRLKL